MAPQHDFVLDNATGANFRADANLALAALVANNSGATEPSTTYAYMWWADTANGLLKIRNGANNAWISLGDLTAANLGALLKAGGTMTGVLLTSNAATVATPDLALAGDTDTGWYSAGANLLGLVANGVELLRADGVLGYLKALGTKALLLPVGTTAQRPTGASGLLRFNGDTTKFEGYNGTAWAEVGGTGGGAGFEWAEIGASAAVLAEGLGDMVYLFGAGLAQELYGSITVPEAYTGGSQIKLYLSAYSRSASGTILLQSQSTLIAKNSTAVDSTTNQRTSTNSALTNTVAKMGRKFELDLTDSVGAINSVAVAGGDIIKFRVYRGTDTDTGDIELFKGGKDVRYG